MYGGFQDQDGGASRRQTWPVRASKPKAPLGRVLESRVLANGMNLDIHEVVKKDGTMGRRLVFKGYNSPEQGAAAAEHARAKRMENDAKPITAEQAANAFKKFYARNRLVRKGNDKGKLMWASPRGRKQAATYDLNHTNKKVTNTARYMRRPDIYDYPTTDAGSKIRKALTTKQLNNLAAGRAVRARNVAARKPAAAVQAGGYWW